jgi:4-carboxymuconolactone decarboxylase
MISSTACSVAGSSGSIIHPWTALPGAPYARRVSEAPRIPIPAVSDLRADVAELLPLIAPPGRAPAATMAVLARQPDLLAPFLGWAAALALNGVLEKRHHELLALRAAWNCRSAFEWVEHVEYARATDLTDDEIAAVARPLADADSWPPLDRALLRAADELHTDTVIADATWRVLADSLEPPALVELVFVVGQYTMLSMVANTAGIEPPPGSDPVPWTSGA